jgi:hypothetical protein
MFEGKDKPNWQDWIIRICLLVGAISIAIFLLSFAIGFAIYTWVVFRQAF